MRSRARVEEVTIERARLALGLLVAVMLVTTSCIVDSPAIENTSPVQPTAVPPTPTTAPVFAPTQEPEAPTATAEPAPIPEATSTPTPEPTPTTAVATAPQPTPLPTSPPDNTEFDPSPVAAGRIAVPTGGTTSFDLSAQRPVLQLPGHTLIYLDDGLLAEVDIFTPVASDDGTTISNYGELIGYLLTNERFAGLTERDEVTIAGLPTRVFDGTTATIDPDTAARAFITDTDQLDNLVLGWYPPPRLRLWAVDHPDGPIVISAESLEVPGQFTEAIALATEILTTIEFG